jgi:hypothetical protein
MVCGFGDCLEVVGSDLEGECSAIRLGNFRGQCDALEGVNLWFSCKEGRGMARVPHLADRRCESEAYVGQCKLHVAARFDQFGNGK